MPNRRNYKFSIMKRSIISILTFCLVLMAMNSMAQKKSKEDRQEKYEEAVKMIESGDYTFVALWAYPQRGRQVNLISNPNSLVVKEGKVKAKLPYFGVVNSGAAAYSSGDGGINIDGDLTDLKIDKNDKKSLVTARFKAKMGGELFNFTLSVNGPENATLIAIGSSRETIRYSGKLLVE